MLTIYEQMTRESSDGKYVVSVGFLSCTRESKKLSGTLSLQKVWSLICNFSIFRGSALLTEPSGGHFRNKLQEPSRFTETSFSANRFHVTINLHISFTVTATVNVTSNVTNGSICICFKRPNRTNYIKRITLSQGPKVLLILTSV